jgi:SAM-dependent methyltransferase
MDSSFWDERYKGEGWTYGREPNDFLRAEASRFAPGSTLLCLAEGEGRNSTFLAGLGHHVTALDFSAQALKKAGQLAEERGVKLALLQADLSTWEPPAASFDGVISIFCHLPSPIRAALHTRIVKALRPGGLLVLESYRPAQLELKTGGPRDLSMLPSLADLERELDGLTFVVGREVEREIHEGALHSGMSATVQVVARAG